KTAALLPVIDSVYQSLRCIGVSVGREVACFNPRIGAPAAGAAAGMIPGSISASVLTFGVGAAGSGSERDAMFEESADSLEIVIAAGVFSTAFAVPSICGRGQSNKIVANNMVFSSGVAAV